MAEAWRACVGPVTVTGHTFLAFEDLKDFKIMDIELEHSESSD